MLEMCGGNMETEMYWVHEHIYIVCTLYTKICRNDVGHENVDVIIFAVLIV